MALFLKQDVQLLIGQDVMQVNIWCLWTVFTTLSNLDISRKKMNFFLRSLDFGSVYFAVVNSIDGFTSRVNIQDLE